MYDRVPTRRDFPEKPAVIQGLACWTPLEEVDSYEAR